RDADGLWTSHVGGHAVRYLGPAHGYAGNVRALANRGGRVQLVNLEPYVLRAGELANWPPEEEASPDELRVQWGRGAPGRVAAVGRGRYSLFVGDLGVALLLRHLLDGDDRFPTMGPFGP